MLTPGDVVRSCEMDDEILSGLTGRVVEVPIPDAPDGPVVVRYIFEDDRIDLTVDMRWRADCLDLILPAS